MYFIQIFGNQTVLTLIRSRKRGVRSGSALFAYAPKRISSLKKGYIFSTRILQSPRLSQNLETGHGIHLFLGIIKPVVSLVSTFYPIALQSRRGAANDPIPCFSSSGCTARVHSCRGHFNVVFPPPLRPPLFFFVFCFAFTVLCPVQSSLPSQENLRCG